MPPKNKMVSAVQFGMLGNIPSTSFFHLLFFLLRNVSMSLDVIFRSSDFPQSYCIGISIISMLTGTSFSMRWLGE